LEFYYEKLEGFYAFVLSTTSMVEGWNIAFTSLVIGGLILVNVAFMKTRGRSLLWTLAIFLFAYGNFYVYSWTSVKGNYEKVEFVETSGELVDVLKDEAELYRVHRVFESVESSDRLPIIPLASMIDKIPMAAAYSPLVMGQYFGLFHALGDVNDSNRLIVTKKGELVRAKPFLDFLNVKYVVSDSSLDLEGLQDLGVKGGAHLYRNEDALPRAFFVGRAREVSEQGFMDLMKEGNLSFKREVYLEEGSGVGTDFKGGFSEIDLIDYRGERVSLSLSAPGEGYLVMSDVFYPGWKATLNGNEAEILKANGMFRAVRVSSAGGADIEFIYDPIWKRLVPITIWGSLLCFILPMIRLRKKDTVPCPKVPF